MFHIKNRLLWLPAAVAAVCLLTFCRKEDTPPEPPRPDLPISFSSLDGGWKTRGIDDYTPLEETWDNFGVLALKWLPGSSDSETVIPGYRVRHDGAEWGYEDIDANQFLKFWDLSAERYLFSAVVPAPDNSPTAGEGFRNTTVSLTTDGGISIQSVRGNLSTGDYTGSSNSPDWMVAQTERTASPLADVDKVIGRLDSELHNAPDPMHDATHPLLALTDKVPLRFHHIMARTDMLVWATSSIILNQFRVEVYAGPKLVTTADWSIESGWTDKASPDEHKPLLMADYLYQDGKTIPDDPDNPALLMSHVQIPQDWEQESPRVLKLIFTTKDEKVYQGTITLNEDTNQTNSWLENKHYRYIIKIDTGGSGETEVILFAVDMDTWKWKEGNAVEEEQTDW